VSDKFLWVLGGSQMQLPVVEEVHALGYKAIVSDINPMCACVNAADLFQQCDIYDISTHLFLLKTFIDGDIEVEGVIASGIDCPETAAAMQEFLGRPTAPRHIAHLCHNKADFRVAMRQLGYPVPQYTIFNSSDTVLTFDTPYRYVIKPADSQGSKGSVILHPLTPHWKVKPYIDRALLHSTCNTAIAETLWWGTEHTVEILFDAFGTYYPSFITDRYFRPLPSMRSYDPCFAVETGLRHPSTLPDYIQRKAYQLAHDLATDLGINRGPFKLDIIVTNDGIRVIEATTRQAGGYDPQYLVPLATGKNPVRAAILTAIGRDGVAECLRPKWNRVALSESRWPPPGRIISLVDGSTAQVIFNKRVGDVIEPYENCSQRVCFVIVGGETETEAHDAMDRALKSITIEVEQ
jgi:biotin carboxylase